MHERRRSGRKSEDEDTVRKAFLLRGRVQGVGFRWWTKRTADQLGLEGTVRNLPDGGVELQMEGPPPAVEEMTTRVRRGPPTARVDRIDELEPEAKPLDGFRILR